jgi:hypothetical protein
MASLVVNNNKDDSPDAEVVQVVEAVLVQDTVYNAIDSCEYHLLALNSNGAVDHGRNNKFIVQYEPAPKTKYIDVSAGTSANYLLRDDGVIVRAVNQGIDSEFIPPPKVKYTLVSSGSYASYFLRDDGKVDRTTGGGKIHSTIDPPTKTKYVDIVAGHVRTFFLREDGVVDYSQKNGKINGSLSCDVDGVKYVKISKFSMGVQTDKVDTNPYQVYLIRSDGAADKYTITLFSQKKEKSFAGTVKCANADVKYISGSTAQVATYLVRSDGAVDRIKSGVAISNTMNPPPSQKYIEACAGNSCSYLLRSDGKIDRTKGHGSVSSTLNAPENLKKAGKTSTCSIL